MNKLSIIYQIKQEKINLFKKKTNYIPKNLITFTSQNNNQNNPHNPHKLSQDNYIYLPNHYFNHILSFNIKSGFDNHSSRQKKFK